MPRIKTTRTVTFALFLLRIYLLAMLLIILTKFVIEARKRNHDAGGPAATGQSAAPAESPGIVFSPFTNERKSTRGGGLREGAKPLRKATMNVCVRSGTG